MTDSSLISPFSTNLLSLFFISPIIRSTKNVLSGGTSGVKPIPSSKIIDTCSGVTIALAIISPFLLFLIGIVLSIFSDISELIFLSVFVFGRSDAFVKLES